MKESYRVPLLTNFWYETDREKDPVLYQDQLGWQEFHKVESGGYTDKKTSGNILWDSPAKTLSVGI